LFAKFVKKDELGKNNVEMKTKMTYIHMRFDCFVWVFDHDRPIITNGTQKRLIYRSSEDE